VAADDHLADAVVEAGVVGRVRVRWRAENGHRFAVSSSAARARCAASPPRHSARPCRPSAWACCALPSPAVASSLSARSANSAAASAWRPAPRYHEAARERQSHPFGGGRARRHRVRPVELRQFVERFGEALSHPQRLQQPLAVGDAGKVRVGITELAVDGQRIACMALRRGRLPAGELDRRGGFEHLGPRLGVERLLANDAGPAPHGVVGRRTIGVPEVRIGLSAQGVGQVARGLAALEISGLRRHLRQSPAARRLSAWRAALTASAVRPRRSWMRDSCSCASACAAAEVGGPPALARAAVVGGFLQRVVQQRLGLAVAELAAQVQREVGLVEAAHVGRGLVDGLLQQRGGLGEVAAIADEQAEVVQAPAVCVRRRARRAARHSDLPGIAGLCRRFVLPLEVGPRLCQQRAARQQQRQPPRNHDAVQTARHHQFPSGSGGIVLSTRFQRRSAGSCASVKK
jgi:hypothetical protein